MAVVVVLPAILAQEARSKQFELDAATIGEALRALPVADLLFDERGELRPLVNVFVDGTDMREHEGVQTPVGDGQTLRVVQAVAGG